MRPCWTTATWKRRQSCRSRKPARAVWIQYEFAQPQTIRSLTIVTKGVDFIAAMVAGISDPEKSLEASDDGQNFRVVVKLPDGGAPEHTVSFPPVTAKFFRVTFKRTPPPPRRRGPAASIPIHWESRSARLRPTMRLPNWPCIRERGSTGSKKRRPSPRCRISTSSPLLRSLRRRPFPKSDVVDLTSKMRPDGTLDWTPPAGQLGRASLRLFPAGNHQPSGNRGSHRP